MANPQPDIFFKWSKELWLAIIKTHFPGNTRQVFDAIAFLTYGNNPSVKEAQIEQKKIAELTIINKHSVSRAMRQLLNANMVVKNDNYYPPSIGINKDYESWKELSKMTTPPKTKGLQQSPKKGVVKNDKKSCQKRQLLKNPTLYKLEKENMSIEIYEFYKKEISPLRKTRKAAIKNICFYLKEYSGAELKTSISNYKGTARESEPRYRKNPSNFFGRTGDSERYFEDYLPGEFKAPQIELPEITTAQDVEAMLDG